MKLISLRTLVPIIKENEFFPAPGGQAGAVNYQTPLNTHSSPEVTQNPENFVDPNANKTMGKDSNTAKDGNPQPQDLQKDLDQVYNKKKVPTADQVKAGLNYEMHNMIKPNKELAKEKVMANLKQDPEYYGALHHLNIDDKHMQVDLKEIAENVNIAETKKIFADMAKTKNTKYVVNDKIVAAMRETIATKEKRRLGYVEPSPKKV